MNIEKMIKEALDLSEWIGDQLDGLSIKSDVRSSLAAGCFHVALEHQTAIAVLVRAKLYGSANALIRVIFEAPIRGLWLYHCASDAEIEKFRSDKLDVKIFSMLEVVEKTPGWEGGRLSKAKQDYLGLMNSFTHTGIRQVERRLSGSSIEPSYDDGEILQTLQFSGAMAITCGLAIAQITENVELAFKMLDRAQRFTSLAS